MRIGLILFNALIALACIGAAVNATTRDHLTGAAVWATTAFLCCHTALVVTRCRR